MLYLSRVVTDYMEIKPKEIDEDYIIFYSKVKNMSTTAKLPLEPILSMYKFYKLYPEMVSQPIAEKIVDILKVEIGPELDFIDGILQPI